jgi:hypothetical protein
VSDPWVTRDGLPMTAPAPLVLDEKDRRWIRLKWEKIRTAQQKADQANNEWSALNVSIKSWLDSSGITDPVQRAKIQGESLALKDALATGRWHAENAQRHIDDVMLFIRLRELGVL